MTLRAAEEHVVDAGGEQRDSKAGTVTRCAERDGLLSKVGAKTAFPFNLTFLQGDIPRVSSKATLNSREETSGEFSVSTAVTGGTVSCTMGSPQATRYPHCPCRWGFLGWTEGWDLSAARVAAAWCDHDLVACVENEAFCQLAISWWRKPSGSNYWKLHWQCCLLTLMVADDIFLSACLGKSIQNWFQSPVFHIHTSMANKYLNKCMTCKWVNTGK